MKTIILQNNPSAILDTVVRHIKEKQGIYTTTSTEEELARIGMSGDIMGTDTNRNFAFGDGEEFNKSVSPIVTATLSTADAIIIAEELFQNVTDARARELYEKNYPQGLDYESYKKNNVIKAKEKLKKLCRFLGYKEDQSIRNDFINFIKEVFKF